MARQGKLILPAPEDAVEFAVVIIDAMIHRAHFSVIHFSISGTG